MSEKNSVNPEWTKVRIEAFIREEELGYQKIALPFGLFTPGADREEVCSIAFGEHLDKKSVLDVGSYLGYFCLRALEKGAVFAHGLEVDPDKIRQANTLAQIKGLSPTYDNSDVESIRFERHYDIVLCLNVLHHLFDPIGTIRNLAQITKEHLVLEVASVNPRDSKKFGVGRFTQHLLSNLPVIMVAPGTPIAKRRADIQKYFFTPASIKRMLEEHTKLFAKVEIMPSTFKKRFIVRATRRTIRHLLVVSGPTSSGKSTFLRMIKNRLLPTSIEDFLPENCQNWPQIDANRLFLQPLKASDGTLLDQNIIEGLVLHYDILRPYVSGTQNFNRDQALDFIQCSDNVTVIVLKPDPAVLISQLIASEIEDTPKKKGSKARVRAAMNRVARSKLGSKLLGVLETVLGVRLRPKDRQRYQILLNRYKSSGWVESWFVRWEKFIRDSDAKINFRTIVWPVSEYAGDSRDTPPR